MMHTIARFKILACTTAASAALLAYPAAAAEPQIVQFEPILVAHDGAAPADQRRADRASRRGAPNAAARRDAPAAMLPGVGPISARTLQSLELNDAQTQALNDARAASRTLREEERTAMQNVRQLRAEQLSANTLDPRALNAARAAAMESLRGKRQAVQNQWLAVWDSFSAEQKDKVVQAAKRQQDRRARGARGERPGDSRGKRG